VGNTYNCPVLLPSQTASATVKTMISERQAAVSKAEMRTAPTRRVGPLRRWPLLWTLSGAVIVSLALWAGIFVLVDAVAEFFSSAAQAH
jgi:hypothetical protein